MPPSDPRTGHCCSHCQQPGEVQPSLAPHQPQRLEIETWPQSPAEPVPGLPGTRKHTTDLPGKSREPKTEAETHRPTPEMGKRNCEQPPAPNLHLPNSEAQRTWCISNKTRSRYIRQNLKNAKERIPREAGSVQRQAGLGADKDMSSAQTDLGLNGIPGKAQQDSAGSTQQIRDRGPRRL